jgi:tetratricopeptide (TPR) repeat protein
VSRVQRVVIAVLLVAAGALGWVAWQRTRRARSPELKRKAGEAHLAGDTRRAIELLTEALAIDPEDAAARRTRGSMRLSSGDAAGAKEDFEALLSAHPGDADLLRLRALAKEGLGDARGALADLDAALAAGTAAGMVDAHLQFRRGGLLRGLGKTEEAEAALTEAIRLDARFVPAVRGRSAVRFERRDFAGALADAEAAIAIAGASAGPEAYWLSGNARRALGDSKGALADYEAALGKAEPDWTRAEEVQAIVAELRRE